MGLKRFFSNLFSSKATQGHTPPSSGVVPEQRSGEQDEAKLLAPLLEASDAQGLAALAVRLERLLQDAGECGQGGDELEGAGASEQAEHFSQILARVSREDPRAALSVLRRYQHALGDLPCLLWRLARLYDSTRDDQAATAVLLTLSRLPEHEGCAWERLGFIAERRGEGALASQYFQRALLCDWERPDLHRAWQRVDGGVAPTPEPLSLLCHQAPEGYRLLHRLGRGSYGTVYRAHDDALDRDVAIKFLHEHLRRRPEAESAFLAEARMLARFEQSGVVGVYDIAPAQGAIIMEYLAHGSLASRMQSGAIEAVTALNCAAQLCASLDELHRQELVHGDIKPENILFRSQLEPVLGDFGLAAVSEQGSELGTPDYLAPDHRKENGKSSDIYAIGLVLLEMLSGVRVAQVKDRLGWRHSALAALPESNRDDAQRIIDAMTHEDASHRPGSALQAAVYLRALALALVDAPRGQAALRAAFAT